ncbi:hypothetical protein HQ395_13660 [Aeromonas hydrophila]|uniref:hypothetical protein n=1 Tax=Aeromonas hydrophila TaxID=644 RepID=UPI001C04D07A|nr:hypothetical protein [Aeromonas hydrophila]QWL79730.1 hypothetical protein HQ395_13660 [Aeromonas hydrophila]
MKPKTVVISYIEMIDKLARLSFIKVFIFFSSILVFLVLIDKMLDLKTIIEKFTFTGQSDIVFVISIATVVVMFTLGLNYLQSGRKLTENDINKNASYNSHLFRKLISQDEDIKNLKERIEALSSQHTLSSEEKEALLDNIADGTRKELIEEIFNIQSQKLKSYIESESISERLHESALNIRVRLEREISDLRLRSNINLLIGMMITLLGLFLLWTIVNTVDSSEMLKALASKGIESNSQFIKNLILPLAPRVMLVIFIEVFAYFFLRLYKNGLSEIKYFQNELTNVESKMVALELAHLSKNSEAVSRVIASLVETERNFILQRGETTVELEKAKSESEMMRSLVNAIPNLFKK